MGLRTDFFDIATRNWRGRLAVSAELMREFSRYRDPEQLNRLFSRRMEQLYPTAMQLTVSRFGLERPAFRITGSRYWADFSHQPSTPADSATLFGGLLSDLLYEDQPQIIDELDFDDDDPASVYLAGQRSLLAIPLYDQGIAQNMIILTREEPAAFPREQVPELVWLSNLFTRATQTLVLSDKLQNLYDSADYELRTVAEFQTSLLPECVPQMPGLDVGVHYQTANRAGGDYYDFFPLPEGKLAVLIADVSGHDTPAAVLMAITHSLIHALPQPPSHPGEFLAYLNHHLAKHYTLTTGHFVTAVCALFDPIAGTVTIANAGHTPPRIRWNNQTSGHFQPIDQARRLPLGVSHRTTGPYPEILLPFVPGAELVIFTDGMVEAENKDGVPFGIERLDAALHRPWLNTSSAIDDVTTALARFSPKPAADDRTLVLVRHSHPTPLST